MAVFKNCLRPFHLLVSRIRIPETDTPLELPNFRFVPINEEGAYLVALGWKKGVAGGRPDCRGGAKRLGKRLEKEGFKVTVRRSGTGVKWLVLVSHRISVEESSIENFRELLEAAVEKLKGGEYDGWEAEV